MHDSPIFKEPPLVITPSLAKKLGLNEAIIIQQIRYWLTYKERNKQDYYNGCYWVYNSYENWEKQFPFWSIATIRRTIKNLEENCHYTAYNKEFGRKRRFDFREF